MTWRATGTGLSILMIVLSQSACKDEAVDPVVPGDGIDTSADDDADQDSESSGGSPLLVDMNQYEQALRDMIDGAYLGTIVDGDGQIACKVAGSGFALDLTTPSAMVCHNSELGEETADCEIANHAFLDIAGELLIDGLPSAAVTGHVTADSSTGWDNAEHFGFDIQLDAETWDTVDFNSPMMELGDEFEWFAFSKNIADSDLSAWEVCEAPVDSKSSRALNNDKELL